VKEETLAYKGNAVIVAVTRRDRMSYADGVITSGKLRAHVVGIHKDSLRTEDGIPISYCTPLPQSEHEDFERLVRADNTDIGEISFGCE
jgi:hypothetical protein